MIRLEQIKKVVASGSEDLTILHPLDLEVPEGQFLSIVGPSGSGKSTLLGLIAGLDAPTEGSVLIDGVNLVELGEDELARLRGERIGFVFQFFHLLPSLTALENVLVPMEIFGVADAEKKSRKLLDEFGLSERTHHYPSQLSGGEQQRVAIARALANDPPILLADEPTGNLDSSNGKHIIDIILGVHERRGTTIVLATHNMELARMLDVTLALKDGRIDGTQNANATPTPTPPRAPLTSRRPPPGAEREIRSNYGGARNARFVEPTRLFLPLYCRRCRVDGGASLGHPERSHRAHEGVEEPNGGRRPHL